MKANPLDTTKHALRYFNGIGTITAMYSNGWSVKDGTIVEGPSKNPYKYIVQFSKEYANLFVSISFKTKIII